MSLRNRLQRPAARRAIRCACIAAVVAAASASASATPLVDDSPPASAKAQVASTVSRLVNMGIEPFLVGTAVNLIQAQRLVRRLCPHCKTDVTRDLHSQSLVEAGFLPQELGSLRVHRGRGCPACNGTGYKGRVGLYEVMEISDEIREMILCGASSLELKNKSLEQGMISLRKSGLRKIRDGLTTVEEVVRETVL